MNISRTFLATVTLFTLVVSAPAQSNWWNTGYFGSGTGTVYVPGPTPPTLPPVQSNFGSYDKSIGNSWLGGSAHAYAGMVRQKQGSYELGNVTVEFRGVAKLLKQTREVAEIVGNATNVMNNGVQSRSGYYRIDVLGFSVINGTFSNSSTFGHENSQFNLIPGGVNIPVPVGPTTVTLSGNAGCGFSRSANWLLPAATAKVGLNANASAYVFANANVAWGVPGFGVGAGIQGDILEQGLLASVSANALWGLSGDVDYTLQAITLHLYAWAQALWTWTTTLASWSSGVVNVSLI